MPLKHRSRIPDPKADQREAANPQEPRESDQTIRRMRPGNHAGQKKYGCRKRLANQADCDQDYCLEY